MSTRRDVRDAISTAREVRKLFTGSNETPTRERLESETDELEYAACLALLSEAQTQLDLATANADPEVMVVPQHQFASVLQSYLQENGDIENAQPLPEGGHELKFQEGFAGRDVGWVRALRGLVGAVRKHPIKRPARAEAVKFPDIFRIAVLGDWGTGMYGALPAIATIKAAAKLTLARTHPS